MKTNAAIKRFPSLFSRRTLMFLFFLFIAAGAWLVKELSSDYHTQLHFDVCVFNSQNSQSPRMCSVEPVPVMVYASGFSIMHQRLFRTPRVEVGIKNLKMAKAGTQAFLLSSVLKNSVDAPLGNGIKVENYLRDTIFFEAEAVSALSAGEAAPHTD